MSAFKIGSVYRANDGSLVRLVDGVPLPKFLASDYEGTESALAVFVHSGMSWGWRRLDNGMVGSAQYKPDHHAHLIPGELTQTASGWVALGAEKQEDGRPTPKQWGDKMRAATDPNAAMIARDGPAKLTQCGDGCNGCPECRRNSNAPPERESPKPNPFPTTLRSPDCESGHSDHLNASRHQMAGMKG